MRQPPNYFTCRLIISFHHLLTIEMVLVFTCVVTCEQYNLKKNDNGKLYFIDINYAFIYWFRRQQHYQG